MTDSADSPISLPEIETIPAAGDQMVDVVPQVAAKRRSKWLIGGAVVAVAALAVGVFAVVGGDKAHAGYSLSAAAASAETAQNVAYEMTMQAGSAGTVEVTGKFDVAHQLMSMDMALPMLGDQQLSVVMDLGRFTMYMDASAFGKTGAFPTKWVSIDLGKVPSMKDALAQAGTNNPLDVAKAFAAAKSVEDLGTEDFRGEQVKHYKVTVDSQVALDANPSLQDQLDALDTELPDTITYDVYIDAENNMRRLSYDLELAGEAMTFDMLFTAVGDIEPIELPDPSDITSQEDIG